MVKILKDIGNEQYTFQKGELYKSLDGDKTNVKELKGKVLIRQPDSPKKEDWWCAIDKSENGNIFEVLEDYNFTNKQIKTIQLNFANDFTAIAGFSFGRRIYEEQVRDKIFSEDKIEIVFPSYIEKISSSFIEGFFSEIVEVIGYRNISKRVVIRAATSKLTNKIKRELYYQ